MITINDLGNNKFTLNSCPSLLKYDYIVFGCPVEAFSLSMVGKKYLLKEASNLTNKKISFVTTEYFASPILGGNNAVKWVKKIVAQNKGIIMETKIINWSNKKRQIMIDDAVTSIVNNILKQK